MLRRIFAATLIVGTSTVGFVVPSSDASATNSVPANTLAQIAPRHVVPMATTPPSPEGSAEQWFATAALSVVRSNASVNLPEIPNRDLHNLRIGEPTNIPQLDVRNMIVVDRLWAAPVFLNDTPVGTLAIIFDDGQVLTNVLTDSETLAQALVDNGNGGRVVVDPQIGPSDELGAWFWFSSDDTVEALDPNAQNVLAGTVSRNQYISLRESLIQSGADPQAADPQTADSSSEGDIVRLAALILAGLLILVAIVVWIRHEYDEDGPVEDDDEPASGEREGYRWFKRGAEEVHVYERPARRTEQLPDKQYDSSRDRPSDASRTPHASSSPPTSRE
ncbi:hypothetical protein I6E29_06385 [Arcanobacterium haemolyticum]|nr:hypothetical protein [Arcanobacterium haemolyticum]